MDSLAIIGIPAIVVWGISVEHRCISVPAQRLLAVVIGLMECLLIASVFLGDYIIFSAFVFDFIIAVVIEIFLGLNIIPSAQSIRLLFRYIPFDLRILSFGGREVYRTDAASKLDNTTLARLAKSMSKRKRGTVVSVRTELFPDNIFKLYRPHAGVALLTEDASELNGLQLQLEQQRSHLERQNEVLLQHQEMRSLLYRQQREKELGERVERDLAATAMQISAILDDCIGTGGEYNADERLKQLNLVKVLVAYCKRKGMLALAGAESETVDSTQLNMIARESMADLNSIGIECAIFVTTDGPLALSAVNAVYDSYYDCIISVLPRANPVLMVSISQKDSDCLEMRATIECAIGIESDRAVEIIPRIATSTEPWTAIQSDIARELEGRLAARPEEHSISLEDGLVNVVVKAHSPSLARDGGEL